MTLRQPVNEIDIEAEDLQFGSNAFTSSETRKSESSLIFDFSEKVQEAGFVPLLLRDHSLSLFKALAHQLLCDQSQWGTIKQGIVEELRKQHRMYKAIWRERPVIESFSTWLANMKDLGEGKYSTNHTAGSDFILLMGFCNRFQVNVMVLSLDPYPSSEKKRARKLHKFVMKPLFAPHKDSCYCIGHVRDSHFMSLTKLVIPTTPAPSPSPNRVKDEVKRERPVKRERREIQTIEVIDLTL
jgi:hypothetical protein